ncbi:response regulator [Massilia sp. Dwa41.01b]|uniref:response regulator n=1 Tax=Massilia sp. Dwa41.01b TaxID=2709302 RepID=UPI001E2E4092|nr:response regulator [Massilia sp. Dwa41.01b]
MACELLCALGHAASGSGSAEQALALLRERPVDILFTDLNLPGMSGIELATRAIALQPTLKVILASGEGGTIALPADSPIMLLPQTLRPAAAAGEHRRADAGAASPVRLSERVPAMPNQTRDARLLLIDDQPFNADLVRGMLASEPDIAVDYLIDPARALAYAQACAPTVILVDLHMPMIDGLEVIRELKAHPQLADVPIIMVSSNDNPGTKAQGFAAGAMDYLVKWPDRIELAARIRAHTRAYRTIVERDQARRAFEDSQAALLQRSEELAAAQASLHEAQKMEALGELTSGIAHDFNDVLHLISGHLQLLRIAHRTHEPTLRRLDAAADGVRRGATLASQMLAFARRQRLQPALLRVDALLFGMEERLREAPGGRGLRIAVDGACPAVALDQAEFGKTMLHLVRNAAEAMGPEGQLAIELAPAAAPGSGGETDAAGWLRIRLADNGAGMTPEVQRRAFEPFFSTKAGNRRSGIGLSLAFGFVTQSGGQIDPVSTPGQGSVVTLYFPAAPEQVADNGAGTGAAPVRTVLVVEDEDAVRSASVEVLRKLGLCVLEAADGETALGLIRQKLPIDLLFTDIVMPGATRGQDLALAAAEHLPDAKVLFASGYPGEVGRDDAVFQRVPLLRKPYRLDEMTRLVQGLLLAERTAKDTAD